MIYLWTVILYLVFLAGVSIWRGRGVKTQEEFMVAGRSASALFLVATLICTWIGSGSLFGGAGRAFREGFSALWMSAGAWVGIAIVYFLAPKVRRIAQFTVSDILEMRYTPLARLLGTLSIIIAYLTIAGYQLIGGGRLISLVTDLTPQQGQWITCGAVVVFVIFAGMRSILALDLINGILIILGIAIAAPIALSLAGGWGGLTSTLPETHFTVTGSKGIWPALGLFFPTFFLLLGESSMYQKFMSAKDEHAARKAVIGMIIGVIVIETLLDTTAIFGAAHYWGDARFHLADGSFDQRMTETVILEMARHQLPVWAGVMLLAGAVAIIFSTATTFLMIPAGNVTRDIYQRFINPQASEKKILLVNRVMVLLLALVAILLTTRFTSILDMALYAYTMVGAAVTPALLAAFLWKRVTPLAGTLSVGAGMLATVVFGILYEAGLSKWDYDYIIYPAGGASILCLIVVSLLGKPPAEEKWRPFWAQ
ncbi:MAG TPA: sodium:solute symporter family protein [Thermoanaerobaculia bacterium]|nr:sodium:solute symporter family protein [Thermoanaerobaculia bacterium]